MSSLSAQAEGGDAPNLAPLQLGDATGTIDGTAQTETALPAAEGVPSASSSGAADPPPPPTEPTIAGVIMYKLKKSPALKSCIDSVRIVVPLQRPCDGQVPQHFMQFCLGS